MAAREDGRVWGVRRRDTDRRVDEGDEIAVHEGLRLRQDFASRRGRAGLSYVLGHAEAQESIWVPLGIPKIAEDVEQVRFVQLGGLFASLGEGHVG